MNNVGFKVDIIWSEFGYSETLYSWFSTICYRLENSKWGSRFPVVMNNFYYDEKNGVKFEDLEKFKNELKTIKDEFSNLPIKDAIWSFEENIYNVPNNKPNLNYNADNLSNFYVNTGMNTIYKIFEKVFERMLFFKANCIIVEEKALLK
ncbi:Imm70 family immunity protein [Aliarcobacter butzleri]|uniref:Imm70 family immunity protein n=1 Tax=Aliarcobacter butzleri TaxID=28197 RepID=A0AAW6VFP6_9BACT|nr:Imm70 family immunity protein [Aliarcobacter butzleri]MDK2040939.1 Imm70 family immunity protein [Aliarcobacter butzleri]MDK2095777.1 Imm70 family immunity protein [Aliarcobacter butzleri]